MSNVTTAIRHDSLKIFTLCLLLLLTLLPGQAQSRQVETPYTHYARYNSAGQVIATLSPGFDLGGNTRYLATRKFYNTQGQLKREFSGVSYQWYDASVNPDQWDAEYFTLTYYDYDEYGRLAEVRRGSNYDDLWTSTQYSYNAEGRVLCKAVRMNPDYFFSNTNVDACRLGPAGDYGRDRITKYEYVDRFNDNVKSETRAVGTPLEQVYFSAEYDGDLKRSITDAGGNRTEMQYDHMGRLTKRIYPSKTNIGSVDQHDYNAYRYDHSGNVQSERKRSGALITYVFDKNNRMIKKDVSGASADVYYDYDLRGLTSTSRFGALNGQGITHSYDGFGRLANTTVTMNGSSRTLRYIYDKNGNRTALYHPDNTRINYYFDPLNRAYRVQVNGSTNVWLSYDAKGYRHKILRNYRKDGAQTRYYTDDLSQLVRMTQDLNGTANDLTKRFSYSPARQLVSAYYSNDQYHYFGNDNREGTYQSNGQNQYTKINGRSLSYDRNGNLTRDGSATYAYDAENRLISVSGEDNATFTYDPQGRLFEVVINGARRQFLYDGDALIAEFSGSSSSSPVVRYVHGDRVDEPLVQYNGSSTSQANRRFLHADHLGSIIAHSNASGDLLSKNAYDAYGVPALGNQGRFGYTGQMWFEELGLYHYKARMYKPDIGRFLQTDPVGYEDQMNLYAYVHNDPMNYTDPTGEAGKGVIVIVAVAACAKNKACREAAIKTGKKVAKKAKDIWDEGPRKKRNSNEQKKFREKVIENNKRKNNGKTKCEDCNSPVREKTEKVGRGKKIPKDRAEAHHKDGNRDNNDADNNGELLCPPCHKDKHK